MTIDYAHPFRNPVPDIWDGWPRAVYDVFNAPGRAGYNPNYEEPGDPVGHAGLDEGADEGSPMYAAHGATVHLLITPSSNPLAGWGLELVEQVTGGWWGTRYMHCPEGSVLVKKGAVVTAGQQIAQVGVSGNAHYSHLHFEIRWLTTLTSGSLVNQGVPLDPMEFGILDTNEQGWVRWPRLLKPGDSHRCVPHLRGLMYGLGYGTLVGYKSFEYTPSLAKKVGKFQADRGLTADKIIGPKTRLALGEQTSHALT